jgi:hypothetical protein
MIRALEEHWRHPARRAELEAALADFAIALRGEALRSPKVLSASSRPMPARSAGGVIRSYTAGHEEAGGRPGHRQPA